MNGVVYIAFKRHHLTDHIKELMFSVKSLKQIHPDIPVSLFTNNNNIDKSFFDKIIIEHMDESSRMKQKLLYRSPYSNTLYLDTDTKIINPIIEVFDLMGRFDIAATFDHSRKFDDRSKLWPAYGDIPVTFPEYAGGVIVFKKSKVVENFFNVWNKNYIEWTKLSGRINDQPSFRVSLWECGDLKVHTLPPEFNIRTQQKRDKLDHIIPRVYHWHSMYSGIKATPHKF